MAQILDKMNIGDNVTFNVYPSALLGTQFQQCTIMAILDADSVRLGGYDPVALHAKVYGTLPAGTPNDSYSYQWLKIKLSNAEITYIGVPWINADTIIVNTSITITVVYTNAISTDAEKIRQMNSANGFTQVSMTVK